VLGFTPTLGQSGVATNVVDVNVTTISKVTKEQVFKDRESRKAKNAVDRKKKNNRKSQWWR
jgi:hypothetical protein